MPKTLAPEVAAEAQWLAQLLIVRHPSGEVLKLPAAIAANSPALLSRFNNAIRQVDLSDTTTEERERMANVLALLDGRGKPRLSDTEETVTLNLTMPASLRDWCKAQEGGAASYIRSLVEADRKARE